MTGGASGIGLGQLTKAAQEGMIPVVLDINEEAMAAAEAQLREAGASDVMTVSRPGSAVQQRLSSTL